MSNIRTHAELLSAFAQLQILNAIIPTKLKGIGLRERVIYFIFFESAAFVCLSGKMSDVEVQKFVMRELFNSEGVCNSVFGINITLNDKLVAYRLLTDKDPGATRIIAASDVALSAFVGGNGDSAKGLLAHLITDKTIFPSIGSKAFEAVPVKHRNQRDDPEEHPMYSVDTEQRTSLGTAMLIGNYLPKLSYGIGAIALIQGSGSIRGWIAVLIIGTWWSRGAISMALQGRDAGDLPDSSVSFAIAVHWICLLGLLACSIVVFAK